MDNRRKNEVLNESIKDLGIVNSYLKELMAEEAPTHKFFSRDKQMSKISKKIANHIIAKNRKNMLRLLNKPIRIYILSDSIIPSIKGA